MPSDTGPTTGAEPASPGPVARTAASTCAVVQLGAVVAVLALGALSDGAVGDRLGAVPLAAVYGPICCSKDAIGQVTLERDPGEVMSGTQTIEPGSDVVERGCSSDRVVALMFALLVTAVVAIVFLLVKRLSSSQVDELDQWRERALRAEAQRDLLREQAAQDSNEPAR